MIQEDLYKSWSSHWEFKTPLYMNHGSFGAAPKAVNDLKMELECEMTRDPQGHFWNELRESYDEARQTIAAFVNAPVADVVLLDNATEALNVVLKSRHFAPGDQILMTNHGYPPFHDLMKEFSRRTGVEVIVARIPFPVMSEADVIDAILQCATARTRLAVIDHISSPTALVFPITDIVQRLNHQGIDTFVDGAHGIGHLQLDMQEIGTAYYASNNHKWLCAPLSSAFLYVRPCRQDKIIPLCGSKGSTKDHPFAERFAWQGTKNMAARLCLPETIRYMAALHPDGWPGIYRRNRALALRAREMFCSQFDTEPPCPESMVGCMAAVPLGRFDFPPDANQPFFHMTCERFGYGMNAPAFEGSYNLRLSAQMYNSMADFERMAGDLADLLKTL